MFCFRKIYLFLPKSSVVFWDLSCLKDETSANSCAKTAARVLFDGDLAPNIFRIQAARHGGICGAFNDGPAVGK